ERNKTIILVAKFDGKKEDEQKVTTHIYESIRSAVKDFPNVEVRSLNEVITAEQGKDKARKKGEARNAKILLWGWYDNDLIGVLHIEVLHKTRYPRIPYEGLRKFNAVIEGTRSFEVKQHLSGEMSYLTLVVIGIIRIEEKRYDEAI